MFVASFDTMTQEYIRFKYQSPEPTYDSYVSDVGNIIKSVEFMNNIHNLSTSELQTSEQPTSELQSQTQRPTIQNLLSHSNQALGVSLQYPSDWKVIDAKENTIEITKETGVTYMEEIHTAP